MRACLLVLTLVAVAVGALLADARGATSANLLRDPGAEQGLYNDWDTANGFVVEQYGAENRPGTAAGQAIGGGANVFAGGSDSTKSTATQTVDVSSQATTIDAGGVTAQLSGYVGGIDDEDDYATVTATFLPANTTATIGPVTAAERNNKTALLQRTTSAAVPAGTRSIRVRVTATRVDGIYTDGYVDNLSLTLSDTAAATPTVTPGVTPGATATVTPGVTPTVTPTAAPTKKRVKGKVKGIKSPGRRIKGKIRVSGKTCKTGRKVVVKKGKKVVGSGRTKSSGAFNIKTKKHKKGKVTVTVRKKTTGETVCGALTKKVPGKN